MTTTIPIILSLILTVSVRAQNLTADTLTLGSTASLRATNGVLLCLDPNNGNSLLFAIDTSDPSFEVPGLLYVGGFLNVGGTVALNSAIVSHLSRPSTNYYVTKVEDAVILVPAGTNRTVVLLPGYDGRMLTVKDSGSASVSNISIVDIHGEKIDGAVSLKLTNNFASVQLIYDYTNLRWWTIGR